jgi:hypothetical protein
MKYNANILDYLTASAIAVSAAEFITLPICTIKTVYQTSNMTIPQTTKHILKRSGYFGFIQASIPAFLGQIVSTSTKFSFYKVIKNYRQTNDNDILNNSINGMLGGVGGALFAHPFDVWKALNQKNESFNFLNRSLYYRGFTGSIGKNIALYSVLYPAYDFYKSIFEHSYIAAPLTTLTTCLITQPFDYYKVSRMTGEKIKLTDLFLLKNNNPFKGFSLMIGRAIPHFFITMSITEYILNNFMHIGQQK